MDIVIPDKKLSLFLEYEIGDWNEEISFKQKYFNFA